MRLLLCVLLVFGVVHVECSCPAGTHGNLGTGCDADWSSAPTAGKCYRKISSISAAHRTTLKNNGRCTDDNSCWNLCHDDSCNMDGARSLCSLVYSGLLFYSANDEGWKEAQAVADDVWIGIRRCACSSYCTKNYYIDTGADGGSCNFGVCGYGYSSCTAAARIPTAEDVIQNGNYAAGQDFGDNDCIGLVKTLHSGTRPELMTKYCSDYYKPLCAQNRNCISCTAGKKSSAGASACSICPVGTISGAGASACSNCYNGGYQGATEQSACSNCVAGKYTTNTDSPNSVCADCSAGYSQASTGKNNCDDKCAVGKISAAGGASACSNCYNGQHQNQLGKSVCSNCVAGKFTTNADSANSECTPCTAGYFQRMTIQNNCDNKCHPGEYSLEGASECTLCPANTNSLEASGTLTSCICNIGYTGPNGEPCTSCASGKYKTSTGSNLCTDCESGKYSIAEAATAETTCITCSSGKYFGGTGATACLDCAVNYYSPSVGISACSACAVGTATAHTTTPLGNSVCTSCLLGYYKAISDGRNCDACEPGKYQTATGQTFCTICAAGLYSNVTGATTPLTCKQCPAGKWSAAAAFVCTDCVPGKYGPLSASTTCLSCNDLPKPRRLYTNRAGMTSCLTCTDVKQISNINRTLCFSCLDGQQEDTRYATCPPCPIGKFSDSSTDRICTACRNGTYANKVGSSTCTNCAACPDSFYRTGCVVTVGGGQCTECQICKGDEVRVDCMNRAGHSDEGGVCRARKYMVRTALCDEKSTGIGLGGFDFRRLFGMTQDTATFQCRRRCDGDSNRVSSDMLEVDGSLAMYKNRSFDAGYCKGPFACNVHSCVIFTPSNDWDASFMQASACPVHIDSGLQQSLWDVSDDSNYDISPVVLAVNSMRTLACSSCENCGQTSPTRAQATAMHGYATWGSGCARECTETLCGADEVFDWTEDKIWKKCKPCTDLYDVRLCMTKEQEAFVAADVSGNLPKIFFEGCQGKSTNTHSNRKESTYGHCVECPEDQFNISCGENTYYATCEWDEENAIKIPKCKDCFARGGVTMSYFDGITERPVYCQKGVCDSGMTGVTVDLTPHRTCNRRCRTVVCAASDVLMPCVIPHNARCVQAVHGDQHVTDPGGYTTQAHSPLYANVLERVGGKHMFSSFENVLLSVDSVDETKRRVCVWNADDIVDNDMNPAGVSVNFDGACRHWSRNPETEYPLLPMQNTVTDQDVAFPRRVLLNTSAFAVHYSSSFMDMSYEVGKSSIPSAFSGDVFLNLDLTDTTNATLAAFVPDDRGISAVTSISRWRVSIYTQQMLGDQSLVIIDADTGIQICDECFLISVNLAITLSRTTTTNTYTTPVPTNWTSTPVPTTTVVPICVNVSYESTYTTYKEAWSKFNGDKFLLRATNNTYGCDKSMQERIENVGPSGIVSHHTLAVLGGVISEACPLESIYTIPLNYNTQPALMGSSGVLVIGQCMSVVFSSKIILCLSVDGVLTRLPQLDAQIESVCAVSSDAFMVQSVVSFYDSILTTMLCNTNQVSLCLNLTNQNIRRQYETDAVMHADGATSYYLFENTNNRVNGHESMVLRDWQCPDLCNENCVYEEASPYFTNAFAITAYNTFFSGNDAVVVMATSGRRLQVTYVILARYDRVLRQSTGVMKYTMNDEDLEPSVFDFQDTAIISVNPLSGAWLTNETFILSFGDPKMIWKCTVQPNSETSIQIVRSSTTLPTTYFFSIGSALLSYTNRQEYSLQSCVPGCSRSATDSSVYFAFGERYLNYTWLRLCADGTRYVDPSEWTTQPVHTCANACMNKQQTPVHFDVTMRCKTADRVGIMSLTLPPGSSVTFDQFSIHNDGLHNTTVVVYTECRGLLISRVFVIARNQCENVCEIGNPSRMSLTGGVSVFFVVESLAPPTSWQLQVMLTGSVFWTAAVASVASFGQWSQPHAFLHIIHEKQPIFVNVIRSVSYESLVDKTQVALDVFEVIPTLSEHAVRNIMQNRTVIFTILRIPTDDDLARLGLSSFKMGHDMLNWRRLHAVTYIRTRDSTLSGCLYKMRLIEIDADFSPSWPGPSVGCAMSLPGPMEIMVAQCHVEVPYAMANMQGLVGVYITSDDEETCPVPRADAVSVELPPFIALQQCTQDAYLHADTGKCVSCESSDKKCTVGFYAPACEALLPAGRQPNCSACDVTANAVFLNTSVNCEDWVCGDGFYLFAQTCVPCTTSLFDTCRRTAGLRWYGCTNMRNEECGPCDELMRPRDAEWTNRSNCSWTCKSGYFETDAHCERCTSLSTLKVILELNNHRQRDTFYKFEPCNVTRQARFIACESSYVRNGTYTADGSAFYTDCAVTCDEHQLVHLVSTSYADSSGSVWSSQQCVVCPPESMPKFPDGSALPRSAFNMNLTCHSSCSQNTNFYRAQQRNSTGAQFTSCVYCPPAKCAVGMYLRTSDECLECHACNSRLGNNSIFTSVGRVDEDWSCEERCADGHFFEGSRDVCLPHSTQHCKDGLEYKVNGTAFQDETCAICTDCTGMRQVSACSVHADATCTDCGKNEWWNSYWRGTDCELACKETYTKLLQPPRCQHCSLCGKGSIRPTEPRNCSHCIPCQSPKPAYARYLEECTWQCFEFYTLIATSNSSECVYTENWQTSDWVAAPEVPLEVVCEVGYRLENFACLRCDTPLGLSNVTMDEQWFWTPGDCTWSCMPDRTHLINNTNGTQTHSCVTWATYRLATLVKRSRRLTAPAPAPPNVTSVVQNSETQPSVEVVLFAAAGFFGFFVCVACCVIMRVKRKRGNYKPLPEN